MRILQVGDDFAALRPCGLTLYSDALMQAQVANGHHVSYVFSGRHYPRLTRPRLKRWTDRGVRMYELIGPPIHSHWEAGTRRPALDIDEPAGEAAFAAAVREARPDIVHVQELARLPSSTIEHAKGLGLPVVMTLHDYKPVCASVRLLDADGRRCVRHEVGEDCARNCASAPDGPAHLIDWTLDYEMRRLKRAVPVAAKLDFSKLSPLVVGAKRVLNGFARNPGHSTHNNSLKPPAPATPPEQYQLRRDVNVRRLNLCDRLIAPSRRVAEIYAELGVDAHRIQVQRLTLPHLERLVPRRDSGVASPPVFVTLGGAASAAKGSRILIDAIRALERAGRSDDFRLVVHGNAEPAVRQELSTTPSVLLAGPYAPADLDRLLDAADVGILPSVWEEAHGFVGIEMLAKGLPVIGNALGGIPEYVRDGKTGWLNRTASGNGLAERMAAAMDDPAEVERLRRSVRALRSEIVRPVDHHVAEVEALYAELAVSSRDDADHASTIRSPAARRSGS